MFNTYRIAELEKQVKLLQDRQGDILKTIADIHHDLCHGSWEGFGLKISSKSIEEKLSEIYEFLGVEREVSKTRLVEKSNAQNE